MKKAGYKATQSKALAMPTRKRPAEFFQHSFEFVTHCAALISRAFEAETGGAVTLPQMMVLRALREEGPDSQIALVERTGIDRSTMSTMLVTLRNAGRVAVFREPDDMRVSRVTITPKGLDALRRAERAAHKVERKFRQLTSPTAHGVMERTLRQIAEVGADG